EMVLILLFIVAPICTFLHEGGHMIGAFICRAETIKLTMGSWKKLFTRSFGKITMDVRLYFFISGQTESKRASRYKQKEAAIISLCGPLCNLIMVAVSLLTYRYYPSDFILLFLFYNSWLGIVNLIPFKIKSKLSDGYIVLRAIQKNRQI